METAYIFDSVRVMYIAFIMIYGISGLLNAMRWRFFFINALEHKYRLRLLFYVY